MTVMASARDLITIFVALETISIPTFVLAGLAQARHKVERGAIKYYLIGVLSSAIMLYGMSFIFGLSGSTLLSDISYPSGGRRPIRCSRGRSSSRWSASRSRSARSRSTSGRPTRTRVPPRR